MLEHLCVCNLFLLTSLKGKDLHVDFTDRKSVKRYLRKISKQRINERNRENLPESGEGEGTEEETTTPKKSTPATATV